jgi:glycosyltransferase involved in cell wall biosynthesis
MNINDKLVGFSIVLPLYNKQEYIKETIDSVLAQTFKNFEVLIIDDGSTDESATFVKSYVDPRIKYFRQENQGVSVARNMGIKLANYEFIAFLDADDIWNENFLLEISDLIDRFSEASGFATSYQFMIEKNKYKIAKFSKHYKAGWKGIILDYFGASLYDPLVTASSFVIRKSVFEMNNAFKVGHMSTEDLELWARLAMQYKIAFCNNPLVTYRKDNDNNSRNNYPIKEDFILLKTLQEEKAYSFKYEKSLKKYLAVYTLKCAMHYCLNGDKKNANRLFNSFKSICIENRDFINLIYGYLKKIYYGM